MWMQNEGTTMKLTAENGVEILSRLMHANAEATNNEYYGLNSEYYGYVQLMKKMVGHVCDPNEENGVCIQLCT